MDLNGNKIIAVDFDGTLCVQCWPEIGEPKDVLIKELIEEKKKGTRLILWTCRNGEQLNEAVEWCKARSLEFDAINENLPELIELYGGDTRKINADIYLDDKAENPTTPTTIIKIEGKKKTVKLFEFKKKMVFPEKERLEKINESLKDACNIRKCQTLKEADLAAGFISGMLAARVLNKEITKEDQEEIMEILDHTYSARRKELEAE